MILRKQLGLFLKKGRQFMQGALSPLPGWKGNVLANPPHQAWLENNPIFAGIDREMRLSVFESWVKLVKWAANHEGKY
jgi:hypothetical protein